MVARHHPSPRDRRGLHHRQTHGKSLGLRQRPQALPPAHQSLRLL